MTFDQRILNQLKGLQQKMLANGELPPKEKLTKCYQTFRDRFGPDVLAGLDGQKLLETMHEHGTQDSLVYWIEFKDDDELPDWFGSISGGSALKFGIYRKKETGEWTTGSPSKQYTISLEEAIERARLHRDELLRGAELLEKLPSNGNEEDYRRLQNQMDEQAPTVSRLAWGHKYFSLLYPEKLDDFHSPAWQHHNILKLLQIPPSGDGRYVPASWFIHLAKELEIPMNWTTNVLNERNGSPHRYWRIGTSDGTMPRNQWNSMRDENCVAIGWRDLGDLSWVEYNTELKQKLKALMEEKYPNAPQATGKAAAQVYRFVTVMSERDVVVASDGRTVLGVGTITGSYTHDSSAHFPHKRPVEWLSLDEWQQPKQEGLQTTVHELTKFWENLVAVEQHILDGQRQPVKPVGLVKKRPISPKLTGIPGRIQAVLERKGQVILYGPPGTGKTYWAEKTALELASYDTFGVPFSDLSSDQAATLSVGQDAVASGRVRMCCFHPAYGYEDFLEGYRPQEATGGFGFVLRDGIFKRVCRDATNEPERKFYLIIDEINRGDIPRIFGELLMVLETNKRGKPILLPLSNEAFRVPPNVYVIGTMNTADRSIALLDTALRRRFGFLELMPDSSVLGETVIEGIPLGPWLDSLNQRICQYIGRDARNLQVGHSYLLQSGKPVTGFARFARVVHEEIIPLLQEYCYEDYTTLEQILGKGLVDGER